MFPHSWLLNPSSKSYASPLECNISTAQSEFCKHAVWDIIWCAAICLSMLCVSFIEFCIDMLSACEWLAWSPPCKEALHGIVFMYCEHEVSFSIAELVLVTPDCLEVLGNNHTEWEWNGAGWQEQEILNHCIQWTNVATLAPRGRCHWQCWPHQFVTII